MDFREENFGSLDAAVCVWDARGGSGKKIYV